MNVKNIANFPNWSLKSSTVFLNWPLPLNHGLSFRTGATFVAHIF